MQSLAAFLTAYQSLRIDEAAIEFKITILSKSHVNRLKLHVKRRRRLPKNILDSEQENDLVGCEPPEKN